MTDQATHQKAFRIAPDGPDITSLILSARDEVVDDPTISHGAARMFVKILDLSVRQSSNVRPGVVTISQTKLAHTFGVSNRTIWSWKWELLKRRVLWMTSQPMPNAWPIDTYHITAIHPPASSGEKTSVEGLWGNGYRQSRPQNTGGGFRRNLLPLEENFQLSEKSSFLPTNSPASGNALPASAEVGCEPPPKKTSGHRRKKLRRGTEADCDGAPKKTSGGSGNLFRRGTEADCEHKKAKIQGLSVLKGGEAPPAPDQDQERAFKVWESRLDDWQNSRLFKEEELFARQLQNSKSPESRELIKRKLAAIRLRLHGPSLPDRPTEPKKPRPARKAPELTEQEILAAAMKSVTEAKDAGIKPLLTEQHKAALKKAGVRL